MGVSLATYGVHPIPGLEGRADLVPIHSVCVLWCTHGKAPPTGRGTGLNEFSALGGLSPAQPLASSVGAGGSLRGLGAASSNLRGK